MDDSGKVLLIIGMHRSGTSLTAQWMSKCGLHMGDRLLGSSPGNKFGHVEDMDFLEFHNDLLSSFGKKYDVMEPPEVEVPDQFVRRASRLVETKSADHRQWGWKEPRTSLFLPFWDKLIDHPYYLMVYRDYAEVVDSLLRREYKTILRRRNLFARYYRAYRHRKSITEKANHYLKVWLAYNRAIVAFIDTKSTTKDYILLKHDELQTNDEAVMTYMADRWGFNIECVSMEEVFRKGHMKQDARGIYDFDPELVSQAREMSSLLAERSSFQ